MRRLGRWRPPARPAGLAPPSAPRLFAQTPSEQGADSYEDRQRWVGRRVQPEDAAFTILPWGLVPQELVKEKIVPEALRRKRENGDTGILSPASQLEAFGSCVADVEQGAELAYRFVAHTFTQGQPVFEEKLSDRVERNLGACFDMQLRQLEPDKCLVEVHEVHDVVVTCAFPLLLCDPTNPENMSRSLFMWRVLGVNQWTAKLHFLKMFTSVLYKQLRQGGDNGLRLAVEVVIRTSETPHFGPGAGQLQRDAQHVLWFHAGAEQDILTMEGDEITFELANMNEALSMIQNTASPEAWAVPS